MQVIRRTDRCGNCDALFRENEKYCRYCGTRRGAGPFVPSRSPMVPVYGPPPIERVRKCTHCDYTWQTVAMIDRENYCPQCGASSVIIEEGGQPIR